LEWKVGVVRILRISDIVSTDGGTTKKRWAGKELPRSRVHFVTGKIALNIRRESRSEEGACLARGKEERR